MSASFGDESVGADAVLVRYVASDAQHGLQGGEDATNEKIWLVNLKGLWNVLESCRLAGVGRVVHLGSCHVASPLGVFNSSDGECDLERPRVQGGTVLRRRHQFRPKSPSLVLPHVHRFLDLFQSAGRTARSTL